MHQVFKAFLGAGVSYGSHEITLSCGILKPELKTGGFEASFIFSELYVIGHDSANYVG